MTIIGTISDHNRHPKAMMANGDFDVERALSALGKWLEREGGEPLGVVVLGGTALLLMEIVERGTRDVDLLALADPPEPKGGVSGRIRPPDPLPERLEEGIERVARDFQLPANWMNAEPAAHWSTGLPQGLAERLEWRRFGALHVGLVSRYDLIFFKLYAAADSPGTGSVHFQDLLALKPSKRELSAAEKWVRAQDPSPAFQAILDQVLEALDARLG